MWIKVFKNFKLLRKIWNEKKRYKIIWHKTFAATKSEIEMEIKMNLVVQKILVNLKGKFQWKETGLKILLNFKS